MFSEKVTPIEEEWQASRRAGVSAPPWVVDAAAPPGYANRSLHDPSPASPASRDTVESALRGVTRGYWGMTSPHSLSDAAVSIRANLLALGFKDIITEAHHFETQRLVVGITRYTDGRYFDLVTWSWPT